MVNQYGSRLSMTPGASTGIDEESLAAYNRIFKGAGLPVKPSTLEESGLGRLASAALSGRSFIKELSGYDINNLPGYISTPIDILASPVGLASLAAAIPTGGASLGAATAGSIGRRLATRAALDVAGGIVGSKAGELVGEYTPGPDWLKTGAGIAAGIAAGGATGAVGGRMLAGAGERTAALEATLPKGVKSQLDLELPKGPLELIDPNNATPINRQFDNVVRALKGKAVNIPYVRNIMDSYFANDSNIQTLSNEVALLAKRAATNTKVINTDRGSYVTVNGKRELLQSVTDNPELFGDEGLRIAKEWQPVSDLLTDLRTQANKLSKTQINDRPGISEEGIYLPRGSALEDGMDIFDGSPSYNRARVRGGKPGTARGIKFGTMEEAIANNYSYPTIEEALKDYVKTVGGHINGQVASKRLKSLVDESGNFIFGTREELIDPGINKAYQDVSARRSMTENDLRTARTEADKAASYIEDLKVQADDYRNMEAEAFGRDIPVEYGKISRTASDGTPIKAQYDKATGKIVVDADRVLESFDDKPWTKPYKQTDGTTATPLKVDQFSTPQEWLDFVEAHERARAVIAQRPGEGIGAYEDRINKLALDSMEPQQFSAVVNDIEGKIKELETSIAGHKTAAETLYNDLNGGDLDMAYQDARNRYNTAMDAINRKPDLRSIEGLAPMQERGEPVFGPRVMVDEINSLLNPDGPIANATKLSKSFNEPLKVFHQLVDISDFGRLLPTMAVMHPFDSFKGIKAGISTMFNPTAIINSLDENDQLLKNAGILNYGWKRRAQLGQALGSPDIDIAAIDKIPVKSIREAIARTSNVTTNGITAMRDNAIVTEILNRAKAGLPINDDTVSQIIKGVGLTSGVPISRMTAPIDLMIQYPRWLQSQIEFVINGSAGLVPGAKFEQQYARNALMRLVATGMATTFAVNAMQGRSTSFLDEKGNFKLPNMRVGNTDINMFGPYGALVNGMYEALKPNGSIEPLIRSRLSPLLGLGWDLGSGSTYMNDIATWNDPKYWVKFAAPYSLTNLTTSDLGAQTLLQGVGVRATPVSSYRQLLQTAEETFHKPYSDLTGKDKQQLKISNPKLFEDLERITLERAAKGDRPAQATLAMQQATDDLLKSQQTMGEMWKNGEISSTELRDQLENLMYATAARKQQIYTDYGLGKSGKEPSNISAALNGYFDLFNKADRGILAGGKKIGLPDWDVLDQLQAQYRATLTPQQQQAIDNRFVQTALGLDWYFKNKQIIQDSGFFDNRQKAVDELKSTIRQAIPGVNNYSDILEAYAKAERTGNRAQMMRINAIQSIVSSRTQIYDNELLTKNPRLYKALVENGYRKQAQGRPLAANISE